MSLKIYEFAWDNSNTDWIYAEDIAGAIEYYLNFTGITDENLTDCKVTEVKGDKLDSTYILDLNCIEPDDDEDYDEDDYCSGYKIDQTFREFLQYTVSGRGMVCTNADM